MDNNAGVLKMQHSWSESDPLHNLGLEKLVPINPLKLTADDMTWLWDQLQKQDYFFDDFLRNNVDMFATSLTSDQNFHFMYKDKAYILVRNLRYSDSPDIHFCLFDKWIGLMEIAAVGKELINFLFRHVKAFRVTATIPSYNPFAKKLALMLGFKFEGEMRGAILYKEVHHNIQIFGLLRSEWEKR